MPNHKSNTRPSTRMGRSEPESRSKRFTGSSLDKRDPFCHCTVTTVLQKLRGEERILCSLVPWHCPNNSNR